MTLGLANAGVAVAVAELPSSRAEIGELVALARTQGLADKVRHRLRRHALGGLSRGSRESGHEVRAVHGLVNNADGMQHIGHVLVGARKKFTRSMPTPGAGASTSTSTDRS